MLLTRKSTSINGDSPSALVASLARASTADIERAWDAVRHAARRKAIQRRGMRADWSWSKPAAEFAALYDALANPEYASR